jgi:hypothetical protein
MALLSSSCSSLPPERISPPADLLQACDPLLKYTGKTCDDTVTHYLTLIDLYKTCSIRHAALSDATK